MKKKKNSITKRYVGKQGNGVSIGNIIILNEYSEYRNEQNKTCMHYKEYWLKKNIYNWYMDNILFITSFKDIGRSNWTSHKRTNEEYFNYFLNITNNINYKLIVYLDEEIKDR